MKKISVPALVLLLCFIIALNSLLFFCFSSPSLNSKHHKFLLQSYELIRVAKSSRASVFLAFNAIIFSLFCQNLKQSPSKEEEKGESCSSDDELFIYEDYVYDSYDDEDDENYSNNDSITVEEEEEEEGVEDDLEKKAREFIEMMNKIWREELFYDRFLFDMTDDEFQSSSSC